MDSARDVFHLLLRVSLQVYDELADVQYLGRAMMALIDEAQAGRGECVGC